METASGRPLVFAFFVNNVPIEGKDESVSEATAAAGRLLGKICEAFYLMDEPDGSSTPAASPKD
jgi:D-alanyl-D-alanine carboxypeptidase/D-alanyl-D-alanine-endopeptidase (penicillin-binding protein 4)